MSRIAFLVFFFNMLISTASYASEIDYSNCKSIQEVIARETQEIAHTPSFDHNELAELYVSRGESYLLDGQYEKAVEDFQNVHSQLGYFQNGKAAAVIGFRAALGEVVSYDNLGMHEHAQEALGQLQALVEHIGCNDCVENRPCQGMAIPATNRLHFSHMIRPAVNTMSFRDMILHCKHKKDKQPEGNQQQQGNQDNYSDILGPDQSPEPGWCEEVVVGTATLMEGIALLAPNWAIKTSLVAVLEAFKQRALKCCAAGGFWKACVAPLVRKWKQWKDNKAKGILPNAQNLPLYIN